MAATSLPCQGCGTLVALGKETCPQCGAPLSVLDYAGFQMRFVASFIDSVILGAANILLILFIAQPAALIFSLIISFGYTVGFWMSDGATPGKMIMGIEVVQQDGHPLSVGSAVLRYFAYLVSSFTIIGCLMIGFTPDKRGLHDMIAGTVVVRKG